MPRRTARRITKMVKAQKWANVAAWIQIMRGDGAVPNPTRSALDSAALSP